MLNETIKQNLKKEYDEAPLNRLSKTLRKEVKTKRRLEKQGKKLKGVAKQENETYETLVMDKIKLLLESITPEKVGSANLASTSKAFRSLLGNLDVFLGKENKKPDQHVNLNIDLGAMSQDEILKMLSDKSNKQDE